MGALSQAVEIIFQEQRKWSNEKNSKKKNKLSNSQYAFLFYFSFLWTLLLSKFLTFSFLVHLKQFKVL
jgi:hypothetical protein